MTLSDGVSPSPHLQRRIREVQVFLEENLDRDVDLRTIAREASLSPYYFTRQFTAYVGVPPYRYLIGLRIDRAKDLLRGSELTVTQICHRVGFNSLSHFTTTFRQHTGLSPSAYRRRKDWEQEAFRFGSITDTSGPPAEQAAEPVSRGRKARGSAERGVALGRRSPGPFRSPQLGWSPRRGVPTNATTAPIYSYARTLSRVPFGSLPQACDFLRGASRASGSPRGAGRPRSRCTRLAASTAMRSSAGSPAN